MTNRFTDLINQKTKNNISISNAIANLSEEDRSLTLSFIGFDNLVSILKDAETAKKYNKDLYDRTQATVDLSNKTIRIVDKLSAYLFEPQNIDNNNRKIFGLFDIGKGKSNEH